MLNQNVSYISTYSELDFASGDVGDKVCVEEGIIFVWIDILLDGGLLEELGFVLVFLVLFVSFLLRIFCYYLSKTLSGFLVPEFV